MTQLPILLIGAGGHANACIDVVEQEGNFVVAGLIGLQDQVGDQVLGYPVLGTDDALQDLRAQYEHAVVAMGQIKTPDARMRLFDLLKKWDFTLPSLVSPCAYVSRHASIGEGAVVMHGAVVNAGASIGRNCILNSQSLIEHDAVIGDHCHISTGAIVNGGAVIGAGTFVGSGTIVRELVRVGDRCVIGMGQRVVANCSNSTFLPPQKGKS